MYKIHFKKSAVKELKKIPTKEQITIVKAIKNLTNDPHPQGHKKLVGEDITYRIRIGNYRVIYNLSLLSGLIHITPSNNGKESFFT